MVFYHCAQYIIVWFLKQFECITWNREELDNTYIQENTCCLQCLFCLDSYQLKQFTEVILSPHTKRNKYAHDCLNIEFWT